MAARQRQHGVAGRQQLPGHGVAQVRVRVDGGGYAVDRRHDLPVRAAWPGVLRGRRQVLAAGAGVALATLAWLWFQRRDA